ncbi:MAG: vitamin B12 dependent-methionine synthase activation domain-containing protein [Melioribacter sp.]|uniref:vitamin B12 dependent-methionine synthase activation domain-containing protein n=1 Tax=Melioribacter sp. TaxID=2052167 RepID=UPI003BE584D5
MFKIKNNGSNSLELILTPEQITIQKEEVEAVIGYKNTESHFSEIINEILNALPEKIEPCAGYVLIDKIDYPDKKSIRLQDVVLNTGPIVTSQLKNAESMFLFLATIGGKMEKWIDELRKEGELAYSYIADIIASAAAEKTADFIHDYIAEEMKKYYKGVSNRYSPGYCDWNVSEQHKIFSFFPKDFCGVTLKESALMTPIKSISGIIAAGEKIKWKDYLCDTCNARDCTYRIKNKQNKNQQRKS